METWLIKGHTLEYIDETHTYLVDGIVKPSITQILKIKFGKKYDNVDKDVLQRASELGTATHKAIEDYCKQGIVTDLKELQNFIFLQKIFRFDVLDNEVPIILFDDEDKPVACGRLDLVLYTGVLSLGDIKRTYTIDKEYLAYQLNLYRIGYQQCYGKEIKELCGLHLREDVRKLYSIPINEALAKELIKEYLTKGE